ncbi:hypothetical protein G6F68_012727 [Rhizopus microsporus]|nr:hypothetical protein G6F68_012727 [Rhizopus microsporus]
MASAVANSSPGSETTWPVTSTGLRPLANGTRSNSRAWAWAAGSGSASPASWASSAINAPTPPDIVKMPRRLPWGSCFQVSSAYPRLKNSSMVRARTAPYWRNRAS